MIKILGPFFSKPLLKEEVIPDFSMFEELEKLFSNIAPNSIIRGAIYMWNQDAGLNKKGFRDKWVDVPGNPKIITEKFLAKAIVCDTQLILDNYISEYHKTTLDNLKTTIGEQNVLVDTRTGVNDPEVRRELFERGKLAKIGYMHDKFFLISEIEGLGKYVVIQMTANINLTQCHQFNNMLIMYNDATLFRKYLKHWENLKSNIEKRHQNQTIEEVNIFSQDSVDLIRNDVTVFFFPRKKCPIEAEFVRLLEQDDRVKIDVAMAYLTRKRFLALLTKLKQNRKKIRILLSDEDQNIIAIKTCKRYGISYKVIHNRRYNKEIAYVGEDGGKKTRDNWQARMHHKFVLIKNENNKITWTGSYNITHPGLRLNDESVVRVTDPEVYRIYLRTFNTLWGHKKRKILI